MRNRRGGAPADSLELLLDTICNMFGGIVFIAMLLSMFASASGESIARSRTGLSASGAVSLSRTVAAKRAELQSAEAALRDVQAAAGMAPVDAAVDRAAMMELLNQSITEAQERLEQANAMLDRVRDRTGSVQQQLQDAKERADELAASADDIQKQIRTQRASRVSEARLPVRRETPKKPFHLAVRYGKVYQLFTIDRSGERSLNESDVTVRDLEGGRRVDLKPGGGFAAIQTLGASERWKRITASVSSREHFFQIAVYPDSFDGFRILRQEALAAGYDYDIVLFSDDEDMFLVAADEFSTQ